RVHREEPGAEEQRGGVACRAVEGDRRPLFRDRRRQLARHDRRSDPGRRLGSRLREGRRPPRFQPGALLRIDRESERTMRRALNFTTLATLTLVLAFLSLSCAAYRAQHAPRRKAA